MRGVNEGVFWALETKERRVDDVQDSRSGFRHDVAARILTVGATD